MLENNILEKVIQAHEVQKKFNLNPQELVDFLLAELTPRQKEIIKARYGLDRPVKQTLESIGRKFNITRERVRQIEKTALDKALSRQNILDKLADLLSLVIKYINNGGYVRLENTLFDELLENSRDEEIDRNCLRFIFSKFLAEYIEPVDIVHTERAWRIKDKDLNHYQPLVEYIKNILITKNQPMLLDEIVVELERQIIDEKIMAIKQEIEDWQEALNSYLEVSKHFKKNLFDKWGLIKWRSVNPKRMRDKIYLILSKDNKPLHYKVIAQRINEEKFDNKIAHPATIHNELILDERFVLVGRGIYALKEWGYKPGVIVEVVRQVFEEKGVPMTKEEIIKEVLKRRMVKEASAYLALSNKKIFERLSDGRYVLKSKN